MLSRSLVGLVLCCLVACSGGSGQTGSENSARACVPGQSKVCAGPSGCLGNQACTEDGSGYDACACGEPNGTGGTGGSISTGGNSSNANTGGSFVNSGGTVGSPSGSSASIGGSSPTGGNSSVSMGGGTASSGGRTPSTGGSATAGGFTTTGGSKPQTGGKTSTTGGAGTGGKVVVTTGGSATATGGNAPTTGGNPSTGGNAPTTGGLASTGGSSSTCTDLQPAGSTCASLAANSMCSAVVAAGYCLATCNACGGTGTGGASNTNGGASSTGGKASTGGAMSTGGQAGTGGTSGSCTDLAPPNGNRCIDAVTNNWCSSYTAAGYCLATCGACTIVAGTGGNSGTGGAACGNEGQPICTSGAPCSNPQNVSASGLTPVLEISVDVLQGSNRVLGTFCEPRGVSGTSTCSENSCEGYGGESGEAACPTSNCYPCGGQWQPCCLEGVNLTCYSGFSCTASNVTLGDNLLWSVCH
jgi:hypothetical protein